MRIYKHNWRTEADIRFELELLIHLQNRGIPVSVPIDRRDGESLTVLDAPEGMRYAVLFTFAEGSTKTDTETSHLYGGAIARLHNAADDFKSRYRRFELDASHLLEEPLGHIRPFLRHRPDDLAFVMDAAERLRARLDALPKETLQWGVCHGDLHGGNVFYTEEGSLTHFDFDCCGFGWRAYDLAVFQWNRASSGKAEDGFSDERWDAFLAAYLQERPLPEIDLNMIPTFVAIRQIWLIGLHTGNSPVWGAWQDDHYFDRKLRFLREWMETHRL